VTQIQPVAQPQVRVRMGDGRHRTHPLDRPPLLQPAVRRRRAVLVVGVVAGGVVPELEDGHQRLAK
jgi:hypothetical protein